MDAIYEVASVTKVFTGTLLADFAVRGLVSLADTVASLAPGALPEYTMTLAQIASHTSGLPRLPGNFVKFMPDRRDPMAGYDADALTAALAHERPPRSRGRHLYSNYGFALLGHILTQRGGAPVGNLVRQRICEPLALHDTGFGVDAEHKPRLLTGHSKRGTPQSHYSYRVFDAAGAITSTASDLLRFVRAQVQADHPLAPSFELARSRTWRGRSFGLGLGWFLSPLGAHTEVWHTGGSNGFSSYVGFVPDCDVGVVVLVDHGPSLWDAFVRDPVEHAARRLLRALIAEA
jgi:CubicO group peptidase (beta-lactamase class C family)